MLDATTNTVDEHIFGFVWDKPTGHFAVYVDGVLACDYATADPAFHLGRIPDA